MGAVITAVVPCWSSAGVPGAGPAPYVAVQAALEPVLGGTVGDHVGHTTGDQR